MGDVEVVEGEEGGGWVYEGGEQGGEGGGVGGNEGVEGGDDEEVSF